LKVIPVLDILNDVGVHAIRGRRKEYKPIKSALCTSSEPLDIAVAFRSLGFSELYVADLNAITGDHENFGVIEQIAEKTGMRLMVDAGVADIEKARTIMQLGAIKVIIGTETLTEIGFVEEAVHSLGPDHVIVSLDMKDRQLLGKFNLQKLDTPIDVLCEFRRMGLTQAILLDLARVGSEEGVDSAFLCEVLERANLKIFVGGGVRNIDDLLKLNEMGVYGVLLATALHSGKITVEDIERAGLSLI
jgi:phosphoribosylformimino-5-aminoimidazole carboxamide ribotide isomerase